MYIVCLGQHHSRAQEAEPKMAAPSRHTKLLMSAIVRSCHLRSAAVNSGASNHEDSTVPKVSSESLFDFVFRETRELVAVDGQDDLPSREVLSREFLHVVDLKPAIAGRQVDAGSRLGDSKPHLPLSGNGREVIVEKVLELCSSLFSRVLVDEAKGLHLDLVQANKLGLDAEVPREGPEVVSEGLCPRCVSLKLKGSAARKHQHIVLRSTGTW